MSAAPILTCGADALDRDTIDAVAEEFDRVPQHVADAAAAAAHGNGVAPAMLILNGGSDVAVATDSCRQWKQAHPDVPVVYVAPTDDIDTKMEAVDAGADQFLVSPIDEEALRFVLRFLLEEQGR